MIKEVLTSLIKRDSKGRFLKGTMPLNLGFKHSEKTKEKISLSKKGQRLGIPRSEETKRKISQSHIGIKHSIASRLKLSQIQKGKHLSEEIKRKISINNGKSMLGKNHTLETRKKLSLSHIGKHHSNQTKTKMSLTWRTKWADQDFALEKSKQMTMKPSQSELYLDAILQLNFPNEWKYVGDGKIWIVGKNPDFINYNGKKQIIEYDSDYWHKNTEMIDKERNQIYLKYGYKTLMLKDNDLKDEAYLINKIKKFNA